MRLPDLLAVGLLAVGAFLCSSAEMDAVRERGIVPYFYQGYYEPAIRLACGQPFVVDRSEDLTREMAAFLKLERDSLSCDFVPPAKDPEANPPTRIWYHLFTATASWWKLTGISWRAVDGLAAVLLSVAAVSVYCMFRLWMPLPIALVLAILSTWPALRFLPYLRDLDKAPFILASLAMVALLVSRRLTRRGFLALMAGVGAWLGFGYGFRPDVAIGIPLLIVAALFVRPAPLSRAFRDGAFGSVVMLAAFLLAATPAFPTSGETAGGCHWHFALLGLSDGHTERLGLPAQNMSWLSHYDDYLVKRTVASYAERELDQPEFGFCTEPYNRASMSLYLEILRTFPASLLARAGNAVLQINDYGIRDLPQPASEMAGLAIRYHTVIRVVSLAGWLIVLMVLLARRVRLGLFACAAFVYLCAYPAIQFDTRHFFHLAFLAWIPVGMILAFPIRHAGVLARAVVERDASGLVESLNIPCPAAWGRAAGILACITAVAAGLAAAARGFEDVSVSRLLNQYLQAPGDPAVVLSESAREGRVFIQFESRSPGAARIMAGGMLRLEFGGPECAAGPHDLGVGFGIMEEGREYKKAYPVVLPTEGATAVLFVPLYFEPSWVTDAWVDMPAADRDCLIQAEWADPRALPGLWISALLPPGA